MSERITNNKIEKMYDRYTDGFLGELRTDIFSLVNQKKADWITGNGDIEAEWDAYCEQLKKMNLDELVQLMQDAYDNYMAAQN